MSMWKEAGLDTGVSTTNDGSTTESSNIKSPNIKNSNDTQQKTKSGADLNTTTEGGGGGGVGKKMLGHGQWILHNRAAENSLLSVEPYVVFVSFFFFSIFFYFQTDGNWDVISVLWIIAAIYVFFWLITGSYKIPF